MIPPDTPRSTVHIIVQLYVSRGQSRDTSDTDLTLGVIAEDHEAVRLPHCWGRLMSGCDQAYVFHWLAGRLFHILLLLLSLLFRLILFLAVHDETAAPHPRPPSANTSQLAAEISNKLVDHPFNRSNSDHHGSPPDALEPSGSAIADDAGSTDTSQTVSHSVDHTGASESKNRNDKDVSASTSVESATKRTNLRLKGALGKAGFTDLEVSSTAGASRLERGDASNFSSKGTLSQLVESAADISCRELAVDLGLISSSEARTLSSDEVSRFDSHLTPR